MLVSPKRLGFVSDKEVTFEHGYVYPEPVKIAVDGNTFSVTEGAEIAQKAADDGYAYVAAVINGQ